MVLRILLPVLLLFSFVYAQVTPGYTGPGIEIFKWTGTGNALDTIDCSFEPSFAYIKRITTTGTPQGAAWKTPSMDTTLAMSMYNLNQYANSIELIAEGIKVTSAAVCNESGSNYRVMVLSSDIVAWGSYVGNDVDVREIPTGYPVYHVGIKRSGAGNDYVYSDHAYVPTAALAGGGSSIDRIEAITGNSFYVDDHGDVNGSAAPSTYYWWTIKDTAFITSKTYVGNSVDDRDIALNNANLFPYMVWTAYLDAAGVSWMRWSGLATNSSTYSIGVADGYNADDIQDHSTGTVQVGTGVYVNASGDNYALTTWGVDTLLIDARVVAGRRAPCEGNISINNKGNITKTDKYR
jgi:hypothetical protein